MWIDAAELVVEHQLHCWYVLQLIAMPVDSIGAFYQVFVPGAVWLDPWWGDTSNEAQLALSIALLLMQEMEVNP